MLKPLGVLGSPFVGDPGTLWPLVGAMPSEIRVAVADYLASGTLLDTDWLGYQDDPLQANPKVRSNYAWATDGVYFWIDSGPGYVREYGIGLSPDVVDHCLQARGDSHRAAAHADELWAELRDRVLPALAAADDRGYADSDWLEQPPVSVVDTSRLQVLGDLSAQNADTQLMRSLAARPTEHVVLVAVATRLQEAPSILIDKGRSDDVLHPAWTRVAPRTIRTDGKYVWREDYAHYVRLHGVAAPDDFVADALAYQPPVLTPDALAQVRELLDSGELAKPERRWMPDPG
ncbi:MAG: hypothetical protein WKF57_01370 [Nakamurella sp.]